MRRPPGDEILPEGAGRLVTERLALRPLGAGDHAWYVELVGGDVEAASRELADDRAHRRAHGFGHLVAVLRGNGEPVAVVELHHAGSGVEGIAAEEVEIGWVTHPAWRGLGLATEAAAAAAAHAFASLALDRLVAYVRPGNGASLRVAAKLGMRERGPGRTRSGDPCVILELRAGGS